jgi:caffeoyl-CoA O-methyltransferase
MNKQIAAANNPKIIEYLEKTFHPEDEVLRTIREIGEKAGLPMIQVGAMDALHLEVLTRATHTRKAVEIGTLFGYSAICIARALPKDGKLYTFEADTKHANVAQSVFKKFELESKIEIFTGAAMSNLNKINKEGPFDLVFIDADKENYPNYLNWAYENLKMGGVVIGDNTFAFGMIADEQFENAEDEATVKALRLFNNQAANSNRFRATLLPTGEGLTLAVKIR